jgi:hypothetical protein
LNHKEGFTSDYFDGVSQRRIFIAPGVSLPPRPTETFLGRQILKSVSRAAVMASA